MNDKKFWLGTLLGVAAGTILGNKNVRTKLVGLVTGAGEKVKSGGCTVKEAAGHTVVAVKENVHTGGEIFRDTYAAGKQGYKASVERHSKNKETQDLSEKDLEINPSIAQDQSTDTPETV